MRSVQICVKLIMLLLLLLLVVSLLDLNPVLFKDSSSCAEK